MPESARGESGYTRGASDPASAEVAAAPGRHTAAAGALPPELCARMEASFNADFSSVRVREDAGLHKLGALACAQGEEIAFRPGAYDPSSRRGQELIGHELAHVVQQRSGRVATPQHKADAEAGVNDDPALEREADEQGARAARGEPAGNATRSAPGAGLGGVKQLMKIIGSDVDSSVMQISDIEGLDIGKLTPPMKLAVKVRLTKLLDLAGNDTDLRARITKCLQVVSPSSVATTPTSSSTTSYGPTMEGDGTLLDIHLAIKGNSPSYKALVESVLLSSIGLFDADGDKGADFEKVATRHGIINVPAGGLANRIRDLVFEMTNAAHDPLSSQAWSDMLFEKISPKQLGVRIEEIEYSGVLKCVGILQELMKTLPALKFTLPGAYHKAMTGKLDFGTYMKQSLEYGHYQLIVTRAEAMLATYKKQEAERQKAKGGTDGTTITKTDM